MANNTFRRSNAALGEIARKIQQKIKEGGLKDRFVPECELCDDTKVIKQHGRYVPCKGKSHQTDKPEMTPTPGRGQDEEW